MLILGRVSIWVTNGSKTALMDVIGFLCVSLGSSTVQRHDSLRSRCACAYSEVVFSSQNGDHEIHLKLEFQLLPHTKHTASPLQRRFSKYCIGK
jgi:hypothetical protein